MAAQDPYAQFGPPVAAPAPPAQADPYASFGPPVAPPAGIAPPPGTPSLASAPGAPPKLGTLPQQPQLPGGGVTDTLAHVAGAGSDLLSRGATEASEAYQHPLEALKGAAKGTVAAMGTVLPSVDTDPHIGQDIQNNPYISSKTKQLLISSPPADETPHDLSGGIVSGIMQPQNTAQHGGFDLASLLAAARGGYEIVEGSKGLLGMGENPSRISLTRPTEIIPNAPKANLVDGVYSEPGSQIAASLRGSSRFDVPAAAADAHAAISEALADRAITASDFKGRNGPAALQAGVDHAIDIHEARAKQFTDPISSLDVAPEKLAQSPELEKQFTPEELENGLTFGDINAKRIELNKQLRRSNFYSKDPSAQYAVADPLADAHAAADQARNLVYDQAEKTTGVNLRPLKQTESNLIKLSDLAESTKNGLSAGAAQNETASPLAKGVNAVKKIIAIKKNPASSLASLANSPETLDLDGFNSNMRKAFADVKAAPGSIMKNGRLIEAGPGVLTHPNGTTPPEPDRQIPLSLDPEKPGYELTHPKGKTPPEVQPRQSALPLTSSYAPMGEHAGLTSGIPGESVPGQNLQLTPPPPGEVGPTPLQNILNFSQEAHPVDKSVPRSLGAAASDTNAQDIPDKLRGMLTEMNDPQLVNATRAQAGRAAELPGKYPARALSSTQDPFAAPKLQSNGAPKLQSNGEIAWPDSYKNPPKGGGGNYAASDLDLLKKRMGIDTAPQGGHAGGGVVSVEELARPGKNYVVKPDGSLTYHGKSFLPEETPKGAAHVTVLPDGTFRVNAGDLTPAMRKALERGVKP